MTQAPSFSLAGINVPTARLEPGKVNVVTFAASWCMPCARSFPKLEVLYNRYKSRGLVIAAVSEDDDPKDFADFLKPLPVTFPAGFDKNKDVATHWHVATMPSTYVVDRSGAIRFTHAGYTDGDEAELERQIQKVLSGQDAPNAVTHLGVQPGP